MTTPITLRHLGRLPYLAVWEAMRAFTDGRGPGTPDEMWLLEHPSVFTLGQAGRDEHILDAGGIPVVHSDRGGQATYHGPGQVVLYLLLDLRRAGLGVKRLVRLLEQGVIALLSREGVSGTARPDAPGVYVDGAKIASLGLRVRNGRCYHGVALNVDLNLGPFARINPCGYPGLAVTRLVDLVEAPRGLAVVGDSLARCVATSLGADLVVEPGETAPWNGPPRHLSALKNFSDSDA